VIFHAFFVWIKLNKQVMELKNKVALVTGGAVRLGKAMALALAKEGAKVALHYHQSSEKAQQTLSQIESLGVESLLIQADLSRVSEIEKMVNTCYQQFNRIDILVNNAAIYFKTPLGETTEKQWDDLFTINLKAPFFCAQHVSTIMKKQKSGKIINIADVAAVIPWTGYIPYSASKAGLIAITKGMATALAPDIQVNAVAPGTVLLREDATKEEINEVKNLTLLKKIGTPEDIVNAVLFLLKGSDFVTGEVIVVDGGRLLV
jgi:NAD(P)-dependent dehydrogenase (short-subunit alcohol dehydrogenase family)